MKHPRRTAVSVAGLTAGLAALACVMTAQAAQTPAQTTHVAPVVSSVRVTASPSTRRVVPLPLFTPVPQLIGPGSDGGAVAPGSDGDTGVLGPDNVIIPSATESPSAAPRAFIRPA